MFLASSCRDELHSLMMYTTFAVCRTPSYSRRADRIPGINNWLERSALYGTAILETRAPKTHVFQTQENTPTPSETSQKRCSRRGTPSSTPGVFCQGSRDLQDLAMGRDNNRFPPSTSRCLGQDADSTPPDSRLLYCLAPLKRQDISLPISRRRA